MTPDYYFPLFEEILHGKLNPLLPVNAEGYVYVQKLQEMVFVSAKDTGIYNILFLNPPTLKARYYQQKILSETFLYIADMREYLGAESNRQIKAYLRDQILDKHLTTCLMRLGEKIQTEKLDLKDLIEPSADADNNHLSDIYIFHLLRVCLAKAYMEIQELLHEVVVCKQTERWLYTSLAGEVSPVSCFLQKRVSAAVQHRTSTQPISPPEFTPANCYNRKQVCDVLKISESTLLRYKKQSDFPKSVKRGNKDMYLKEEIEKWKGENN
jgi:predicted DNA-binding transcriptional regulator AlpA